MLRRLLALITIITFFALPVSVMGQGAPDPDDPPPCGPPPFSGEPCIPIDGGVSFLIAAGVAYGGKKAFDLRKKH
jgi:hypothetical protein